MKDVLMGEPTKPGIEDLWDFVAGFHPLTRAKVLYRRLDLLAVRDELAADLDEARITENSEAEEAILQRIREITTEIEQSRFVWKIQQLTDSRRVEILEECEAEKMEPTETYLRLLTASTIQPEGIELEQVKALVEVIPNQMAELVTDMLEMAEKTPNPRLTAPF